MRDVRKLTDAEKTMILYFHQERGDVTRWTGWDAVQPILERWHPELLKALRDVQYAKGFLDMVVHSLEGD